MAIWYAEIKELEKLHEFIKGQLPDLEKELERLIKADDENMILLYSRRCLEVIITDLCECELKRPRKTEPLKGIIDKLHKEEKIPSHIISSMYGLNELSTYGAHPKDFDPEQVKPVLNNLYIIIKWYLKYKDFQIVGKRKSEEEKYEIKQPAGPPTEKSIAVLPFVNMSPEKDQDYFCDGITEEIINALAHIENFKVIARTSAFAFKDKQADIREIGQILDVETLLEGSVRKSGNQLRVTAQLIRVADGSHIWSERYDREMKDVFAIQDEISLAIVDNLKVKLLGETKKAITARKHSENLEAYNLYLKGTYYYQMLTAEGFKKASEYFEQALQKDPDYALAYVGLGYVNWLNTAWGNVPPDKAYPKANEYANEALKIDTTFAEIYSVLGNINTFYYWNWKEAERCFKHALQINPNSSMIHVNYSALLTFTGRHKEAISEATRAQELDPLSGYINTRAGEAFHYAGQYDRAIEEYRMTLAINPNYYLAHLQLGRAYYFAKGKVKEAVAEYEKAVDLSDGNPFVIASLVCLHYQIGEKDQAEKLFYSVKKRAETEYVPATSFYLIHRFRGDEDLALEWLKKACIEHDTFLPWLRANPVHFPEGSKYMGLLKEMGLDY
jgi:TolB-like protein/Tfp pilus assembly protein PilF